MNEPVHLSRLTEVASGVLVATSRRYATTSTVLLDGRGGAVVVDPAWDADELAAIPADLAALGARCVAGIATHQHYDHLLWHRGLGTGPRWASPGTVTAVAQGRQAVLAPLRGDVPDDVVDLAGRDLRPLTDGLPWDGPEVIVHVHHAHAPHHLAVEIPDLGVLLAGDMLSDVELPMPDDDDADLLTYRTGLESLADAVRRSRLLVPGHGSVSEAPIRRYDADLRYLDDLESTGRSDDPRIQLADMPGLHEANQRRARSPRA